MKFIFVIKFQVFVYSNILEYLLVTMYHFLNMFVKEIIDRVHNQGYIQYVFVDQDNKLVVLVYTVHLLLNYQSYKLHLKKYDYIFYIYIYIFTFSYTIHISNWFPKSITNTNTLFWSNNCITWIAFIN